MYGLINVLHFSQTEWRVGKKRRKNASVSTERESFNEKGNEMVRADFLVNFNSLLFALVE